MKSNFCKGGCGQNATYKGWCKIKWFSRNKFGVGCPLIEKKRGKSISIYRLQESREGKNPMQDLEVCKRNHTTERNKKASQTLRFLGEQGLLPQQVESTVFKERRRSRVSASLRKLWLEGKHPRQLETYNQRRNRLEKMAATLRKLGKEGKLPVQNLTFEQRQKMGKKISKSLIEGIKSGRIKLSPSWKRVKYKDLLLRSQWEKIVARFLDRNRFKWEYGSLKVEYFDSDRKTNAVTIPDFYLPFQNLIIEVKSNAEYNSQKTKDKSQAIIQNGFNFILAGKKDINTIETNENDFLNRIANLAA